MKEERRERVVPNPKPESEITTIRELVEAIEARGGMGDLRQWYAEDLAEITMGYKKIDLIEMIVEGRQPISHATADEIAEHLGYVGLTLGGAVNTLGDLATGLLSPSPKIKIHGGWHDGLWYCPYCGECLQSRSERETCKETGVLSVYVSGYCSKCDRAVGMTVMGIDSEAGPGVVSGVDGDSAWAVRPTRC